MSACFYDNGGAMVGIDAHTYITVGPAYATVPVMFTPHGVAAPLLHPLATYWKRTGTVLAEGRQMIQRGFKLYLVPHIPLTGLAPHAAEVGQLAKVIAKSSSKSYLGVASVSGEGSSLAVCVSSCVGANGNCGPGLGVVLNPSSVITSPTAADYAGAVASWSVGLALGPVWKKIPNPVLRFIAKKVVGSKIDKLVRFAVSSVL